MQRVIQNGTRAVSIYSQQPRKFAARLYVNCNPTFTGPNCLGDATMVRRKFLTLESAVNWAQRTLAA